MDSNFSSNGKIKHEKSTDQNSDLLASEKNPLVHAPITDGHASYEEDKTF